jgi:hypothetical protein
MDRVLADPNHQNLLPWMLDKGHVDGLTSADILNYSFLWFKIVSP